MKNFYFLSDNVMAKCDKWKTGCYSGPRYRLYPYTFVDRTKQMWKLKKSWFGGVEDMTIVTPSRWLADLVKQSFLNGYDVRVINNGIDLDIFKPTAGNFREKYTLQDKKIVLGVASGWGYRKGLDVFIELSKRLPEDYKIVLVGTDDSVDKKLPPEILSIHRTCDQQELAQIYTAADVFVNPTREENFPTVNIESLACGTPVLTYRTGGSPECIDASCGIVVDRNDEEALYHAILQIAEKKPFSPEACRQRALQFSEKEKYNEYVQLYRQFG